MRESNNKRLIGWALLIVGWLPFCILLVIIFVSIQFGEYFGDLGLWLEAFALPFVVALCAVLTKRGRRLVAKGAGPLEDDVRPPIVYLRPFLEDKQKSSLGGNSLISPSFHLHYPTSYEERLANALRGLGPFIALGQPNEQLPPLGASRLYCDGANWQQQVAKLIAGASLIFFRITDRASDSLFWELNELVRQDKPQRLILCLAEEGRLNTNRKDQYKDFKQWSAPVFPQPLPTDIQDAQFLYFDEHWNVYPFATYGSKPHLRESTAASDSAIVSQRVALDRLHEEFAEVNNGILIFLGLYALVVLFLFILLLVFG